MISLKKARTVLGKTGEEMSDVEIEKLKNNIYSILSKSLDNQFTFSPKCKKQ